jgi:2-polyprenyl-6-methoxyphenol hydroxylase-like FAD-dependent oxidoreductase
MKDSIIVAGGGIGGLAAALALANKGRRSIVLEQSAQFGEIGAGIQLAPNAFHAFDALGIGERARKGAVFVDELVLMDAAAGQRIVGIPVGERFRTRFGNPYAVVHRADLHDALLDACRARGLVDLRVSSRVSRYDHDGSGVIVSLASGERLEGAALIGADGLWSAVRAQMVDDGPPIVSGHTTYRSVIPTDKMPEDLRWNAATLWAGPKCHLVHYPLKDGKVFNLVVTTDNNALESVAGLPAEKRDVHASFPHICDRARQIIDHGENWKRWVLCYREPIADWVDGPVALLGDAAHPMLQYFAQGAAMAMEDAVCLGEMVEAHESNHAAAFAAYNRRRAPRTGRVQIGSRLIGEYIYHPDGAKAEVRDVALRANSADNFYDSLDWLYGKSESGSD